jgi:glycosyltransferase involved in cell wall biosynthesis
MQDELVSLFGYHVDKTVVIRNPIEIDRIKRLADEPLPASVLRKWRKNGDEIILVAAGRLSHEKGFDLLIEAIAILSNPRFRLVILGDGPLREDLERLAVAYQIADQVEFVGFVGNPYRYFARASAVILSSRTDAFPNVVLEALACGSPVIATPASGGVREILDGRRGCLICEEISAESLASGIANYRFDSAGARDASDISEFSAEQITTEYAAILSGLVSSRT